MDLTEQIAACGRCRLRERCGQVVAPSGNPKARIFIVGEHPGAQEDLMGEPFKDRDGLLLRRLLAKAGIDPKDAWLTYTVKCKPTIKLDPQCTYVDWCKTWLWKELQAVSPRVVVTLGKMPAILLLKLKKSFKMKDVAGQFQSVPFMQSLVVPWYHPNWILQHGKLADSDTIEFFKRVKEKADGVVYRASQEAGPSQNV